MESAKITVNNLSVWYYGEKSIDSLSISIPANKIFGIIGPARSGKTTFLRCLNRLNDLEAGFRMDGEVFLGAQNIYDPYFDVFELRSQVGMVFAQPITLPDSIFNNVALGLTFQGGFSRAEMESRVEESLRAAYLWDEVKDRLNSPASNLSGGQQQRLCLSRALALLPQVLLLDEPSSGLDPISTAKIEEALQELKKRYTIVLVTNNVKQAARVSDNTAFFLMGKLVECDRTDQLFTNPKNEKTEEYISGRFG